MRRFEIAALDVGDWDPAEQSLRVAHGKGDRLRTVYLSDSGALPATSLRMVDLTSVRKLSVDRPAVAM